MSKHRYTSSTGFLVERSNHGYYTWKLIVGNRDSGPDDPYEVVIWADSTDEHADQNVNWEVISQTGWVEKRGHARSVRSAIADLAKKGFLR